MLEIYRSCPKCGAHLLATDRRCACGQPIAAAFGQPEVSRPRKLVDWVVFGLLCTVLGAGLLRPDWCQAVVEGRVAEAVRAAHAGRPPWSHPGHEPAARAWAWKLEGSLETGCSATFHQVADKKMLGGMLNFQLVGGTLAASKHNQEVANRNHQAIPWLTPEEVADGAAALGGYEEFVASCLVRGYEAVEPCERFKDALGSPEAARCLVPPVQTMLSGLAWRTCAANARLQRVRELCEVAAKRMDALLQAQVRAQTEQQPVNAGM